MCSYCVEPPISFPNSTDKLPVQTPILLKDVSQIHIMSTMFISINVDTHVGNSNEYNQVHVQYPYMVMSPDSYIPLAEPQYNLYICMGVVYYCENVHFLRHRSEHTCASGMYYQMD